MEYDGYEFATNKNSQIMMPRDIKYHKMKHLDVIR